MAKAHQSHIGILVFDLSDEFADFGDTAIALDIGEHGKCSFVGATVRGAPQAGDASRDGRKRIGARRRAKANSGGRRVLLVVSMQDEDPIHCAHQHLVDFVVSGGHGKHHAHEI